MKNKKQKALIRPRHKIVENLIRTFFLPYAKRRYNIEIEKFNGENRPYLILSNHQTAYDQFFIGEAIDGMIYYVASEDIFSLGFISKVINYLIAPIPIKKQVTDVKAVLHCNRISKAGGTIALFPEGNRTYSGKTEYINPAIAGLVKLLKLPIAFFRIEGGYGVHPRWADDVRKGSKMRAYVSKVMEVEEYSSLDNNALYEIIKKELFVDDTTIESENYHKNLAESVERAIYICPNCGITAFKSKRNFFKCNTCNLLVEYLPNKKLKGASEDISFEYLKDWYDYQSNYVNNLDLQTFEDKEICKDIKVKLFKVVLYKKKKLLNKKASITLYNDKIVINNKGNMVLPLDEISAVTVLGKNKLNVYHKDSVYQIKGDRSFNAIKYVNIYHHYKNLKEGNENGGFLGL